MTLDQLVALKLGELLLANLRLQAANDALSAKVLVLTPPEDRPRES